MPISRSLHRCRLAGVQHLPRDDALSEPLMVAPAQIVVAILGCYAGVFGLVKLKSAFSAKKPVPTPAVAAPAAVAVGGTASKWGFEPPTLDTFDEWEKNEENWKKWEVRWRGV